MSHDRNSLIRLYEKIKGLKDGIGWVSKRTIDKALQEWKIEDRRQFTILKDIMRNIDNVEKL
jgi:hypothetical protein